MVIKTGLLAAILAAMLLAGCGSDDNDSREQQIEAMARKHGVNADVSLDARGEVQSVTINSANGAQIGKNLQLPEDFPSDVPMAPDWAVMSISPAPGGFMVHAMTDVSAAEALAATREQLTSEGWVETGFAQTNTAMAQIRFAKGDRITNVNLMDTGAQRTVQLLTMTP
tara:strand:+ start:156649 stop:157155 length:507 start_codon:yes stop_codon:yes gene_type:complete